jgi:hypothetical protein
MPAPTATAMPMSARSQVPSERFRLRSSSTESAIVASTVFTRQSMSSPSRAPAGAALQHAVAVEDAQGQRTTCMALAASVSEPVRDG